jgi:hypothetical protein
MFHLGEIDTSRLEPPIGDADHSLGVVWASIMNQAGQNSPARGGDK